MKKLRLECDMSGAREVLFAAPVGVFGVNFTMKAECGVMLGPNKLRELRKLIDDRLKNYDATMKDRTS